MADLTITAANVIKGSSANLVNGIAGATITAGQAVYLDSAAGTYKLAQCDGTAAEADAKGIAMHASLNGQPITICSGGEINIGATTAKTTTYLVSSVAGGVAPQADIATATWRIVKLGYAINTTGSFIVNIVNTGAQV